MAASAWKTMASARKTLFLLINQHDRRIRVLLGNALFLLIIFLACYFPWRDPAVCPSPFKSNPEEVHRDAGRLNLLTRVSRGHDTIEAGFGLAAPIFATAGPSLKDAPVQGEMLYGGLRYYPTRSKPRVHFHTHPLPTLTPPIPTAPPQFQTCAAKPRTNRRYSTALRAPPRFVH